jgi:hypothetical protein
MNTDKEGSKKPDISGAGRCKQRKISGFFSPVVAIGGSLKHYSEG